MQDNLNDILSKPWQTFLERFKEIETLPIKEWKELHLLAYFCKRYKKYYGKTFALSFKSAPSKSTEIVLIKKMRLNLSSYDLNINKAYLDWLFDIKIPDTNLHIRSLGIVQKPEMINEFNIYYAKQNKVVKSTSVPDEYKEIANKLNIPISNYGDLAFAHMAINKKSDFIDHGGLKPYVELFDKLKEIGFEPSILKEFV